MTSERGRGITRRKFLIASLCAGGAAIVGAAFLGSWPRGRRDLTVVFRNPAYNLRREADGTVLVCQTPHGEFSAYRLDDPAAWFWEQVPTAEAFSRDGRRVTVEAVIEAIAPRFSGQNSITWQRDARHFVQETLQRGILLSEGARVKIAYTPPVGKA